MGLIEILCNDGVKDGVTFGEDIGCILFACGRNCVPKQIRSSSCHSHIGSYHCNYIGIEF